jgi:hypothetical protein
MPIFLTPYDWLALSGTIVAVATMLLIASPRHFGGGDGGRR